MNTPHGIRRGLLERETGIEPVRDFLKKGIYLRNLGLFCADRFVSVSLLPALADFPASPGKNQR